MTHNSSISRRNSFNPISASNKIIENYRNYILSTFKTNVDSYNQQLRSILNQPNSLYKGPILQISDNYIRTKTIDELIDEGLLSEGFHKLSSDSLKTDVFRLFKHQEEAIRKILRGKNVVVSTGTGSGKTQSFIIPILHSLLEEAHAGKLNPGVRAIIIYPMNALANDQKKRMRDLLQNYPDITFGTFTGETEDCEDKAVSKYYQMYQENPLPNELISREKMRAQPPHILITNYVMLEHLLIRPKNNRCLLSPESAENWKFLVIDEVHTYAGATGSELSMLLRRLRASTEKNDIIHILTSATLGEKDENQSVANFASALCTSEFNKEDIVRGYTEDVISPPELKPIELSFYSEIAEYLRGSDNPSEKVMELLNTSDDDYRELLYDLIQQDPFYYTFREAMSHGPKDLNELSEILDQPLETIVDFVTVANETRKGNRKLFESKYHLFVNSLEGVYVTLKPSYRLETKQTKQIQDGEDFYKAFQISVCYNCNAVFIIGIIKHGILEQPQPGSEEFDNEDGGNSVYLLLDPDTDVDNIGVDDAELYFKICSKCGKIRNAFNDNPPCNCGKECHSILKEVKRDSEKLSKCGVCGQIDTKRGLLRQFYVGQDAATSVLCSSLYSTLPSDTKKQFIVFSDNRQSAAYFSTHFNDTYHNILGHRSIVEILNKNEEEAFGSGIRYKQFQIQLENLLESIYDDECEDTHSKAVYFLAQEAACNNSNKSLEYNGFLRFDYQHNKQVEIPGLNQQESVDFINTLVKIVRDKLAVSLPDWSLDQKYQKKLYRTHSTGGMVKTSLDANIRNTKKVRKIAFKTKATERYISAVIGDSSKVNDLIDDFINNFLIYDDKKEIYQLPLEKLVIRKSNLIYKCDKCRKHYPYSVRNICPKCGTSTLKEMSIEIESSDNHYVRQYQDSPLTDMVVKEHTAQLESKIAAQYQLHFVEKKINVLSCSTTFEMGVDIGDLNTVMMRNVPPSPANYAQRAGRAGRTVDSSSFALTYCRSSPHDAYYFSKPLDMITGLIPAPIIKTDNPRIVLRHIFASAIASYWNILGDDPREASIFLEDEYLHQFYEYLNNCPDSLNNYLRRIVPGSLHDYSSEDLRISLSEHGWVQSLINPDNGRLTQLKTIYDNDLKDLDGFREEVLESLTRKEKKFKSDVISSIERTIRSQEKQFILSFLSKNNILPKYGFPVDLVNLEPNISIANANLDLQRDLSMAISEYAPDSQIIADSRLITSRYVKKPTGLEWDRFAYKKCESCGTMNTERYIQGMETDEMLKDCSACEKPLSKKINFFIIPKYGFYYEEEEIKDAAADKPVRTYHSEVSYRGNLSAEVREIALGSERLAVNFNIDDELVVINSSRFYICEYCGFGTLKQIEGDHKTPYGRSCKGFKKPSSLGHIFKTDVAIVQFLDRNCFDKSQALSVMYSMIEALCKTFNIERREVSGCLHYGPRGYYFVFFDNTPGGAGYVKVLNDPSALMKILDYAKDMLESCNCGGATGEGACYSCLRDYSNQRHHQSLSRGLALNFLKSLNI